MYNICQLDGHMAAISFKVKWHFPFSSSPRRRWRRRGWRRRRRQARRRRGCRHFRRPGRDEFRRGRREVSHLSELVWQPASGHARELPALLLPGLHPAVVQGGRSLCSQGLSQAQHFRESILSKIIQSIWTVPFSPPPQMWLSLSTFLMNCLLFLPMHRTQTPVLWTVLCLVASTCGNVTEEKFRRWWVCFLYFLCHILLSLFQHLTRMPNAMHHFLNSSRHIIPSVCRCG